jgi:hypothetical protein
MPPTHLDLTKTYTHADMILSSRNSPRISLRRAASYNNSDRGPQSSTSSRFSFNHLIASPPPSPGLPALVPRHGKPVPNHTPRKFFRGFVWLMGFLVVVYLLFSRIDSGNSFTPVGWANNAGDQYEMVGESELPEFPTPVMITDKKGRPKWTISIPPDHDFPLAPNVYSEICTQNMEVAMHVADLRSHSHKEHAAHYDYYHVDPNFMDVWDAEAHGLLPGPKAKTSMKEDAVVGENQDGLIESEVCAKSMTFLLETGDAGLGKTLMMLWTAYGLAKKEGREFFIEDSKWYVSQSPSSTLLTRVGHMVNTPASFSLHRCLNVALPLDMKCFPVRITPGTSLSPPQQHHRLSAAPSTTTLKTPEKWKFIVKGPSSTSLAQVTKPSSTSPTPTPTTSPPASRPSKTVPCSPSRRQKAA